MLILINFYKVKHVTCHDTNQVITSCSITQEISLMTLCGQFPRPRPSTPPHAHHSVQ